MLHPQRSAKNLCGLLVQDCYRWDALPVPNKQCDSNEGITKQNVRNKYTLCLNKNVPPLASCSFDKYRLISIIFGKQHQRTFKNMCLCNFPYPFTCASFIGFLIAAMEMMQNMAFFSAEWRNAHTHARQKDITLNIW